MKKCPHCSESKSFSEFYTRRNGQLSSYCKECSVKKSGEFIKENETAYKAYQKEYQRIYHKKRYVKRERKIKPIKTGIELKGRHDMGSLSDSDIISIFNYKISGLLNKEIAVKLNLGVQHISNILNRRSYKHVDLPIGMYEAAKAASNKNHGKHHVKLPPNHHN